MRRMSETTTNRYIGPSEKMVRKMSEQLFCQTTEKDYNYNYSVEALSESPQLIIQLSIFVCKIDLSQGYQRTCSKAQISVTSISTTGILPKMHRIKHHLLHNSWLMVYFKT